MAYIGKTPSQATRSRFYYTATGGETSLSGADDNGNTLVFSDGNYVDVMLNGVTLVAGTDYNTTTANTIGGLTALTASDIVEIVVYDTFSVFGGDVKGDFTITNGQLSVTDITANDSNGIQFNTDEGTQRAVIDDSGNLLVGKTSTDSNVEGSVLYNDSSVGAMASFCSDGIRTIIANRKTSDGQIIDFRKDGSSVGSIGVQASNNLYIAGQVSGHAGVAFESNVFVPLNAGSRADDFANLGESTHRFKDLYLSGGVYLGGTGSANHLDDYEEGTWTPTFSTGYQAYSGVSAMGTNTAYYTKIGNLVHCLARITLSTGASGDHALGSFDIGGLPFSHGDTYVDWSATAGHGYSRGAINASSGSHFTIHRSGSTTTTLRILFNGNSGGYASGAGSAADQTDEINLEFVYRTTS